MKHLIYGLAVLLLCGQLAFSQDTAATGTCTTDCGLKVGEEPPTPKPSPEAQEIAALKLDLLASQKATLEARSELLTVKSRLLQLEVAIWNDARDKTQAELDELFGCKYDLDRRACQPKPE